MAGIALQRLARRVAAREIFAGIERKPTGEHPGQHEDAGDQAGDVVPCHPASIGRDAAARIATLRPDAQNADPDAGDADDQADTGDPEHHQPPQRPVLAQHGRIDPVRDRAEPVPDAFGAVGVERDLAGARGDIKPGTGIVAERNEVKRPQRIVTGGDAPLIAIDDLFALRRSACGMMSRDRERLLFGNSGDDAPVGLRRPPAVCRPSRLSDTPARRPAWKA